MKLQIAALAFLSATLFAAAPAWADVKAVIDKSEQQIYVYEDGVLLYTWDVSTGRPGHGTPSGTFGVLRTDATHFSASYNNAPMPWSVFFYPKIAIHGVVKSEYKDLGHVASHGCVRLTKENAKIFFDLVQKVHAKNVTIVVQA